MKLFENLALSRTHNTIGAIQYHQLAQCSEIELDKKLEPLMFHGHNNLSVPKNSLRFHQQT